MQKNNFFCVGNFLFNVSNMFLSHRLIVRGKTNEGTEEEGEKEEFLLFLCGVWLISQSVSGFSPVSSQSQTDTCPGDSRPGGSEGCPVGYCWVSRVGSPSLSQDLMGQTPVDPLLFLLLTNMASIRGPFSASGFFFSFCSFPELVGGSGDRGAHH